MPGLGHRVQVFQGACHLRREFLRGDHVMEVAVAEYCSQPVGELVPVKLAGRPCLACQPGQRLAGLPGGRAVGSLQVALHDAPVELLDGHPPQI